MNIRQAKPDDLKRLAELRLGLWPSATLDEHVSELQRFFAGSAREPLAILVCADGDGRLTGFCELSIRAYAESCNSDRVAYLEGWYVIRECRRRGVGRSLVLAAEAWARDQGCTEFASDAEADNRISRQAHDAMGFEDVGLIRCFRKTL